MQPPRRVWCAYRPSAPPAVASRRVHPDRPRAPGRVLFTPTQAAIRPQRRGIAVHLGG